MAEYPAFDTMSMLSVIGRGLPQSPWPRRMVDVFRQNLNAGFGSGFFSSARMAVEATTAAPAANSERRVTGITTTSEGGVSITPVPTLQEVPMLPLLFAALAPAADPAPAKYAKPDLVVEAADVSADKFHVLD